MADLPGLNWLRADTVRYFGPKSEIALWVGEDVRDNVVHLLEEKLKRASSPLSVHLELFLARWKCFAAA